MELFSTPLAGPRLRPLDLHWTEHNGEQHLLLRDPLGLTDQSLLVPAPLVPLLWCLAV